MSAFGAYVRAFGNRNTYNVRSNSFLWLGVVSGLLVPAVTLALDVNLFAFRSHPTHIVLLLHPVIMGVLFGAMGTVRRDLEIRNESLMKTLEVEAITDPLTTLFNRRFIMAALKNMLGAATRSQKPFSVIVIDLDGFKAINEIYGHPAGDRVLIRAANALKSSLREYDVLGRYGGDEFLLLNPGDRASGEGLVRRAVEAVHRGISLSLSAGIACWPEDGDTPEALIDVADARLRVSKKISHETRRLHPASL